MEKLIYLMSSKLSPEDLKDTLIDSMEDTLNQSSDIIELTIHVGDVSDPRLREAYAEMNSLGLLDASISIWLDSIDYRHKIEEVLSSFTDRVAGYSVTESVPREYQNRTWQDGTSSPTMTVGTAFSSSPGLDDVSFFRNWHESHTPLSLEIHPLLRYVRNTVSRVLTPGAPSYRGIVFESVESADVLTDVDEFFGGEENMKKALEDMNSFIDFQGISSRPMGETILLSAPWRRPMRS